MEQKEWFVFEESVAQMNVHTTRTLGWLMKTMMNEFTLNTVQQNGGYK
jgi:hypothetical protein